jgi:hypothetical protein
VQLHVAAVLQRELVTVRNWAGRHVHSGNHLVSVYHRLNSVNENLLSSCQPTLTASVAEQVLTDGAGVFMCSSTSKCPSLTAVLVTSVDRHARTHVLPAADNPPVVARQGRHVTAAAELETHVSIAGLLLLAGAPSCSACVLAAASHCTRLLLPPHMQCPLIAP